MKGGSWQKGCGVCQRGGIIWRSQAWLFGKAVLRNSQVHQSLGLAGEGCLYLFESPPPGLGIRGRLPQDHYDTTRQKDLFPRTPDGAWSKKTHGSDGVELFLVNERLQFAVVWPEGPIRGDGGLGGAVQLRPLLQLQVTPFLPIPPQWFASIHSSA